MSTSTQTPISLPSREEVENWNPEQVVNFLTNNNDGLKLYLRPEDIKIVQDQYVADQAFLGYTEQKLRVLQRKVSFPIRAKSQCDKKRKTTSTLFCCYFGMYTSGELFDTALSLLVPPTIKRSIADAFPKGLPYVAPKPLLYTNGLVWEYQSSPTLLHILQKEIKQQYAYYRAGEIDKTTMPLYLFLSGADTGNPEMLPNSTGRQSNFWPRKRHSHYGKRTNRNQRYGSLMLMQLLPNKKLEHIIRDYEPPFPLEVLELVAKHKDVKFNDATFIVVVDAMQTLMASYEDRLRADSQFYRTLTVIGDLALFYFHGTLQSIFDMRYPLMKILEGDCGEHGRALEILWNLTKGLNLDNCDVSDLMHTLWTKFTDIYGGAFPKDDIARAIARVVLTHRRLAKDELIPNFPIRSLSLDSFEKTGRESLFPDWRLDDYDEHVTKEDRTLPNGSSWEILKDSKAHLDGDINFINHRLDMVLAAKQVGPIDVRQHRHVVVNAKSAKAEGPIANEIQQYKLYNGDIKINQKGYDEEREKSASKNDFFILTTTQGITLPANSGIVDQESWRSYFDPFTGRAFIYGVEGAPNLNRANFTTLQLVDSVGPATAKMIMEKRIFEH
ncbi:12341_t:CDS:2 [Ambispora leptoticha]|uniref:12341_t:CDS:1 n=1 Tax=Ambispora leptoticha TaxID=144679 RepID=A0A9N8WIF9_9GLOM|nr:12341_t:CDS:2 [Ambispora leptoticha]